MAAASVCRVFVSSVTMMMMVVYDGIALVLLKKKASPPCFPVFWWKQWKLSYTSILFILWKLPWFNQNDKKMMVCSIYLLTFLWYFPKPSSLRTMLSQAAELQSSTESINVFFVMARIFKVRYSFLLTCESVHAYCLWCIKYWNLPPTPHFPFFFLLLF